MNLLIESFITSLFIIGLYYATSYELDKDQKPTERNVLWFIRYYVDKYIKEPLGKPLILCPQCMASFWGILFYFGVFRHTTADLCMCVVFIFMTSAFNKLIQHVIER